MNQKVLLRLLDALIGVWQSGTAGSLREYRKLLKTDQT
jgi:hypothetical protein